MMVSWRLSYDWSEFLFSADVQQMLVTKQKLPPEQQNWSSRLDQNELKPTRIKEEQEEADIIEFIFSPGPVKIEDD